MMIHTETALYTTDRVAYICVFVSFMDKVQLSDTD